MSRRITITIDDDISDEVAITRLLKVIQGGKISEANNKKHYCWVTTWEDGIRVYTREKYGTDSDRFVIYREKDNKNDK